MATLKLESDDGAEAREISLDQDLVTIGRGDDNVCSLEDQAASRHHVKISRTETGFLIKDLGSSNGTWVNRERIETQPLADGDEIRIGGTTMIFSDPEPDEATVMIDMKDMKIVAEPQAQPVPSPPPVAPPPVDPPPPEPLPVAPPPVDPPPPEPPPIAPPFEPPPPIAPPSEPPPLAVQASQAPQPPSKPATPRIRASSAKKSVGSASQGDQTADFWLRFAAFLIDSIIMSIAMMVIVFPAGVLAVIVGPRSQAAALVLTSIGWIVGALAGAGYLLVPWAWTGRTPGKKMLGLKIIRDDGVEPLGFGKAGLRLLGYMAGGAIFYVGFIMAAFTDGGKALHDKIAGTRVIVSKD